MQEKKTIYKSAIYDTSDLPEPHNHLYSLLICPYEGSPGVQARPLQCLLPRHEITHLKKLLCRIKELISLLLPATENINVFQNSGLFNSSCIHSFTLLPLHPL